MNARAHDMLAVVVPNGLAVTLIHSMDAKFLVDALVGVVTIAYTIWRWRKDAKK